MKKSSLTKLTINSAKYYAYHGVKKEEQKLGGKYEVDLDMYYNAKQAIVTDDVNQAINYEEAMFLISEIITGQDNYALLETIASEIIYVLLEKFQKLEKVTVRVRKLNPPMRRFIDNVEVEQTLSRVSEES